MDGENQDMILVNLPWRRSSKLLSVRNRYLSISSESML